MSKVAKIVYVLPVILDLNHQTRKMLAVNVQYQNVFNKEEMGIHVNVKFVKNNISLV